MNTYPFSRPLKTLVGIILLAALAAPALSQNAKLFHPAQVTVAEPFFRASIDTGIDYVLAHDPDRLLVPFRTAAGLEPKAEKYGNWESSGLDGHSAGHFLSALATLSQTSDNSELDERLDYMLAELALCQEANGNGYAGGVANSTAFQQALLQGEVKAERFSLNGAWVPWYNLHKTFAGLKDAWLIAERQQAKVILIKFANWAETVTAQLSDEQMQQMLYAEHGGMNEIFAEMYQILGDERYRRLAYRFTHHELLDPLLEEKDELTGFHANTQIPKVIGFERTAIAADDSELHQASLFFWKTVVENRSVSIGGNSVREHFHPADDFTSMMQSREGPETCNTHNMMRLADTIFQAEPSSKLVDFYERALYNHILSAQHPETGGLVYFTSMRPRHYRVYSVAENAFWCCVGSGIENPGRYSEFVYARQEDSLFVNLFISSKLEWKEKGLKLSQTAPFPHTTETSIRIEAAPKKKLAIKIRRPDWTDETFELHLNGKPIKTNIDSAGYATIERRWKAGDEITAKLPMNLQAEQLPDGSDFVSFRYGPFVLAAKMGSDAIPGLFAGSGRMEHVAPGPYLPLDEAPMLIGDIKTATTHLKQATDGSLEFELVGDLQPRPDHSLNLVPFYQIHESRYSVYWQVASSEEYAQIQTELAHKEAERLAIEQRTLDQIAPGEQQSEVEHDYEGIEAYSDSLLGKRFRAAAKRFSYTLNSSQNESLELALTIIGSEWGKACRILIGETEIGTIELNAQYADQFREIVFEVPSEATEGERSKVTIEAIDNRHTPMVFEISLRRNG